MNANRAPVAAVMTASLLLITACGGGSSPGADTGGASPTASSAPAVRFSDADAVIDSFIRMVQGPEEPHVIDRSRSNAELMTRREAESKIELADADTLSQFPGVPSSNRVWLVELHGEFQPLQFRGYGIFSPKPRAPGTMFGVVDTKSGVVNHIAIVWELSE